MIHETLLILAGHPSSLLSPTSTTDPDPSTTSTSTSTSTPNPDLSFLHPGELASLQRVAEISRLHGRVLTFAKSCLEYNAGRVPSTGSHGSGTHTVVRTRALSALCSTLVILLRPYTDLVISLERRILSQDPSIVLTQERPARSVSEGPKIIVPMSLILGEFSSWEGVLRGLEKLAQDLEDGPSPNLLPSSSSPSPSVPPTPTTTTAANSVKSPKWTPAPLLTLLEVYSHTGVPDLGETIRKLKSAVEKVWMTSLRGFIIFGSLEDGGGVEGESLVKLSEAGNVDSASGGGSRTTTATSRYNFPPESLPTLPNLQPSLPILSVLNQICTALSILHHTSGSAVSDWDGSWTGGVGGRKGNELVGVLPRGLRDDLMNTLEELTGPGDQNFGRAIGQVRVLLSNHIFQHLLPPSTLLTALHTLSLTFLLRHGALTSNLITEITRLRQGRLLSGYSRRLGAGVGSGSRLTEMELGTVLVRMASGTELEDAEGLGSLDAFKLVLIPASASVSSQAVDPPRVTAASTDPSAAMVNAASQFSDLLLGPRVLLTYRANPALSLCLDEDSITTYGLVWSYLTSVKLIHTRLLSTWTTLANRQRERRRWTRVGEGGVSVEESKMREGVVRGVWGTVRGMVWFWETMWAHFQTDVIDPSYRQLITRIQSTAVVAPESAEPASEVLNIPEKASTTPHSQHQTPHVPSASTTPDRTLDFTTLTTLHSLYLATLMSGLMLSNATLSVAVRAMIETCEEFAGKVERWGGDVLPGLLDEGSISGRDGDDAGNVVRERYADVQELNRTFQSQVSAFFEAISTASSSGRQAGGADASSVSFAAGMSSHYNSSLRPGFAAIAVASSTNKENALDPLVIQARLEAEVAARSFLAQLLLRLDFNSWYSVVLPERREQEQREKEEAVDMAEEVLKGLELDDIDHT